MSEDKYHSPHENFFFSRITSIFIHGILAKVWGAIIPKESIDFK